MEVVKLIQPHEFGDNFIFEDGKWKVKFPPIPKSGVEVSKDVNNLITLGGDGGMFADVTRLHAYALVQDNENMKIHLYRHHAGVEFDITQAVLISSIDMIELNGRFDDITITDAIMTFKDVQTDTELVFDTEQFQNVSGLTSDDTIRLETISQGPDGNPIETTVKQIGVVLRDFNNLIENTPEGLLVLPVDGVTIEHSLEAMSYQTDAHEDDVTVDEFVRTINDNVIRIPAVTLKNSSGRTLGAIVAKIPDKLYTYEPA